MNLGSLLGDLEGQDPKAKEGNNDPLSSLLGDVLKGAEGGTPAPAAPQPGDKVLGSLGGLDNAPMLGGSGTAAMPGAMPTGDLGSLLGALMNGAETGNANAGAGGGLLGAVLGGIMGGGMSGAPGNINSALEPLANTLADKLGISRQVAMAVVGIVVPVIMSKMSSGQQNAATPGQGLRFTPEEQTQMVNSLSQQTGLSHPEATETIQKTVQVLAGH